MKTLIERASDKGWSIYAGTLQAQGLFNAIRNGAATDNDVTAWCSSRNDAARAALEMSAAEFTVKPKDKKVWTVYDPRDRQYICAFDHADFCAWSDVREKAFLFDTKRDAQHALTVCGYVSTRYVIASHKVKS